jgi:hypothetical protein
MGYSSIFERAMAGTRQLGRQGRRGRRAGIYCRLRLEPLEDRRCPSTITVTSIADSGAGTLRNALANAVNGDTIDFAPTLDGRTIVLTTGQLNIQSAISIVGPGANLLSISNPKGLILQNIAIGPVGVSGLTIRDGFGGDEAGGVRNEGTLVLQGCVVTNNSGLTLGGAILNFGSLQVIDCTLTQNHSGGHGGAIANQGVLTVVDSTIANNNAASGGAIYDTGSSCTLTSVTLTGNVATVQAGGVDAPTDQPIIDNSIIAANTAPTNPDVVGTFASKGFNLIGATDGSSGWMASDLTGTAAIPLNPGLGALQGNGGATPTNADLAHSPALNTGDPALLGTQDQRGITRGALVDIGAFQVPAAVKLEISAPALTTAGTGFQISVTVLDASNNVDIGYTGTVHFTTSDGQALLPADTPFSTADAGVKVFVITLSTAGSQSIIAADTVAATVQGSSTISVAPAAASRLVISGLSSAATAGLGQSFTVTALDPFGNVATGYGGTVHFTSSDSAAALPGDFKFSTADQGTHLFSGAIFRTAGAQTLSVTDTLLAPVAGSTPLSVLNPGPVVILPGPATTLIGVPYTGTGSFSDPAVDAYSAQVNYGDGSGPTPLALGPGHTFVLNHLYSQEGTFTVTVTLAGTSGPSGQATQVVNVFAASFINPVIAVVAPGQVGTATTSLQTPEGIVQVTATLDRALGDMGPGIILVAIYPVNPVPQAALTDTLIVGSFEVRGFGLTPSDTVLLTFEVPGLGRQTDGSELLFFNRATGKLQPVIGVDSTTGKSGPISGITTAGQLILSTILNSSTVPPVTGLSGTVFTVAVSTTVPAALQVNSPVAEAPRIEAGVTASAVATDVPGATAVRTTTFLRTSSLSLTLRASQDVQSGDSHQPGGGDAPAPDNNDQASLLQTIVDGVLELFGLKAKAKTNRPAQARPPAKSTGPQSMLPVPLPLGAPFYAPAPGVSVVGSRLDTDILDQVLTSSDRPLPKVVGDEAAARTSGKVSPVHLLTALAAGAVALDTQSVWQKRPRKKGLGRDELPARNK